MSENDIGLQPKVVYVGPTLKKGLLSRYTVFGEASSQNRFKNSEKKAPRCGAFLYPSRCWLRRVNAWPLKETFSIPMSRACATN